MKPLSFYIQNFFLERLTNQLKASQHTVSSYRDTFKLLLIYTKDYLNKSPQKLSLKDFDSELVASFLKHLENDRGNSLRTTNVRLAAIHSFCNYVIYLEPTCMHQMQRILSMPLKKAHKRVVTYLTQEEVSHLLKAPDQKTWIGRRDHLFIFIGVQTGLRVSELISLKIEDITFGTSPHVRCTGKGRKERCTPLTKQVEKAINRWIKENSFSKNNFLFPSTRGGSLSRDSIEKMIKKYSRVASENCPAFKEKSVTPHVLRHTTAVHLLQAGVDTSLIALYLGHESVVTTQIYLKADLSIKEKALQRLSPLPEDFKRFKPGNDLINFLKEL